jgi:uncharacterized protein (DUF2141 family)
MRVILPLFLILASNTLSAATGRIEINITGFKSDKGQVMLALHDNADSFPTKPKLAIQTLTSKIESHQAKVVFENIKPGVYAIAVFHDENMNNTLDSNFLGIPKEGVGTSRDAKGCFGPPKFADAKFQLTEKLLNLQIPIHY